ncbi:MAG: ABC transporter permease subunit [Bacteroidales bacterium]|jgi:phosphate transport system permease protein|nr:ABC transporter permease subunit [Bacteroidales bacterium]MDD3961706.1 ABC transporter permease subunit [Bacteroidales bacterium]
MKNPAGKLRRLQREEAVIRIIMRLATYTVIGVLGIIIFTILRRGLPSLSWEMIFRTPQGGFYFGKEGGILNAIAGSLYLATGATLLAFVTGYPVALFMNSTLRRHKRFVNGFRFILDLLWGIPSIVYGAFGFSVMIFFRVQASLLAGILVVAVFVLPIMIRAMDEGMKNSPVGLMEASLSLGMTPTGFSFRILSRQCLPGIVTAVLLSFGRAIGDAASVLFTTGFTDYIPRSLAEPAATLPLSIFFQLTSPIPEVRERAYAAASVLTFIILVISILARLSSAKLNHNAIKN